MWFKAKTGRLESLRRIAAGAVCILTIAGLVPSASAVQSGEKFPEFAKFHFHGELPSELQGKIVLVDFWASWCAPCKASFPALASLHQDYAGKGVVVLGVSVDQKPGDYEKFIRRMKPVFPTVRDQEHGLAAAAKPPTMPSSFLIDRAGIVRFVHAGFHSETPAELRRQIDLLLEEKS